MANITKTSLNLKIEEMQANEKHKNSNIFYSSQDSNPKLIFQYSQVQNIQTYEVFKLIRISS